MARYSKAIPGWDSDKRAARQRRQVPAGTGSVRTSLAALAWCVLHYVIIERPWNVTTFWEDPVCRAAVYGLGAASWLLTMAAEFVVEYTLMHVPCLTALHSLRAQLFALIATQVFCLVNNSLGQAPEKANEQATEAVRAWYQLAEDGSDQAHLIPFGTVGSGSEPLHEAYVQLSPRLRMQMSETEFFAHYRALARLRLLQAHAANEEGGVLRVFVEEERIAVLGGVPAMAWFAGFVEVSRTSEGWKISSFTDVKPEDIISMVLGGHQPWRANPEDVARVGLKCSPNEVDCEIISNSLSSAGQEPDHASTAERPVIVTIQRTSGSRRVELARLHSGEWIVVKDEPVL